MTKKELIALTKEVREKIEKLRAEMNSAIDSASETDDDVYNIPHEEDCVCNSAFIDLRLALNDFVHQLTRRQDLPQGTLVMCKVHESKSDGWWLHHYWKKGKTLESMDSEIIHSGWLYVVPLRYFKPTSTDWQPAESHNWAKFREGE